MVSCQPYAQAAFLVLIFTRGAELEGNMSLKNPATPPGIDSGTVRLVAQCLDHYARGLISLPSAVRWVSHVRRHGCISIASFYSFGYQALKFLSVSSFLFRITITVCSG
jgi:hypothetical protein